MEFLIFSFSSYGRKEVYLEHGFDDCACFRELYATTQYLKRKEEETGG